MNRRQIQRRRLITGLAASALTPWRQLLAARTELPVTPPDAEGPFYPVEIPSDSDNDLMHVVGQKGVSPGQQTYLHGSVVDRYGTPIDGARVEIWQCDQGGAYHHPRAPGRPDPRFQGFGATVTDDNGTYNFQTLRPVPYGGRTPHIHYRVSAAGFNRLTTQLYVAEEADRNARDILYSRHTAEEKALLTTSFRAADGGAAIAEFNIVLG